MVLPFPATPVNTPLFASEFLTWFRDNTAFVYAVATLVLSVILIWVAINIRQNTLTTRRAVLEFEKTRGWEVRPYVVFCLSISPGRPVYAVIRNIGRTPARDISVTLNEDIVYSLFEDDRERHLENVDFLRHTPSLVPAQELKTCLETSSDKFYARNRGVKLTGFVTYKDTDDKTYKEDFHIDTDNFVNVVHVVEPGADDVVKALDGIKHTLESLPDRAHRTP